MPDTPEGSHIGSGEDSDNDDGETTLTPEELETQQDEKKASDLMWADPLYLLAAKERIAFVNQIAEKNLDYTDKEYAKIFQSTFGQNDGKQYRAENLKALHHYHRSPLRFWPKANIRKNAPAKVGAISSTYG